MNIVIYLELVHMVETHSFRIFYDIYSIIYKYLDQFDEISINRQTT